MVPGQRAAYVPNFRMPAHCPICGSAVVREAGEMNHRCTGGLFARRSASRRCCTFAQRRAMDVEGWAKSWWISWSTAAIRTPPDLYRPARRRRWRPGPHGEKSAQNVLDALEKSKRTTLPRFCSVWHPPCGRGHGQGPGAAFRQR